MRAQKQKKGPASLYAGSTIIIAKLLENTRVGFVSELYRRADKVEYLTKY
jgi:hypothetical protein